MESEDILIELRELSSQDSIKKSELMRILKKYAHTICVYGLMDLSERMKKEGEYLDEDYREHFLEIYIKNFILWSIWLNTPVNVLNFFFSDFSSVIPS
jgi:hypothetical protein